MLLIGSKRSVGRPVGPYEINYGHPLAHGISSIFLPGTPTPVPLLQGNYETPVAWDAVQKRWITVNSSSGTYWAWGDYGIGIGCNAGGSNSILITPGQRNVLETLGFTLLIIRRYGGYPGALFGNWDYSGTLYCEAQCPWYWDANVNYFDFGGAAAGVTRLDAGAVAWSTTKAEKLAFSAGAAGMSMWREGRIIASQSIAVTRTNDDTHGFSLHNGAQQGSPQNQVIHFAAIYKEQLDPSFISWWMAEPFGMILPLQSKHYYGVGTAKPRPQVVVIT